MPRILAFTLAVALLLVLVPGGSAHPGPAHRSKVASVFFSPHGEARAALLAELRRAEKSIHVAMYLFTDRRLADVLEQRAQNGVDVRVILDDHQARSKYSQAQELTRAERIQVRKLPPREESSDGSGETAKMHHKFCVIDGRTVVTGSYNWTVGAEARNHENLLILHMKPLAGAYSKTFAALWQEAGEPREEKR